MRGDRGLVSVLRLHGRDKPTQPGESQSTYTIALHAHNRKQATGPATGPAWTAVVTPEPPSKGEIIRAHINSTT